MNITLNEGAMATFIDIHDNEVVNLSVDKGEVRVNGKGVKTASKTHAGRRKETLFEDEEEAREKAEFFLQTLADKRVSDHKVDSSMKNPINKEFKCFYKKYVGTEEPNGSACFRFLSVDCGLEFVVAETSYGEFIRKFIKE